MPLDPFAVRDDAAGETLRLPPWEERQRYGLLNALYLTIKDVLFTPASSSSACRRVSAWSSRCCSAWC